MKTLLSSIALLTLVAAASTQAAPVINISYSVNAQSEFESLLGGTIVVENFDSLGTNPVYGPDSHQSWENKGTVINTNVGTFTLVTPGQTEDENVYNNELMIESKNTGEDGRDVLATYQGDLWLDSNDARVVTWDLGSPLSGNFNALGFYLSDASDVSATLTLTFSDGTLSDSLQILPIKDNGNLAYVTVISDKNIVGGTFTFANNTNNDGWGIDDIVVGNVPEPGTLLLLGLGLLGLGAARRRISH